MKYFKNLIGIALIIILALAIINFHKIERLAFFKATIGSWFGITKQRVDVFKHNLSFTFAPERKPPLSFLTREAKLSHLAKNVFGQFSSSQWDDFWSLLYGSIKEEQGGSMVKRYRTQDEIEDYLKHNYSNPFRYFKKEHWDYFWSIAFGV